MRLIDRLRDARRVCVDSAPLIYFLQSSEGFASAVAPLFQAIERREKQGVSSVVTLLEILVKPMKEDRQDLVRAYTEILTSAQDFVLVDVDDEIAVEAARIRARYAFKTPDAIELATARLAGADAFVTNDAQLSGFPELDVVVVSEHLDE